MPITPSIDVPKPKLILTVTGDITTADLRGVSQAIDAEIQKNASIAAGGGTDLDVEWRYPPRLPRNDPDWQSWARHYDTLSWQVSSIFATASVLLAGNFAQLNRFSDPAERNNLILLALAVCGLGLILFQMVIVGAFR